MPTPKHVLPAIVLAQFLGTSPWFAVNAVMPDLQRAYGWSVADLGAQSAAVQMGFIAGTLVFALLALADRFSARRMFAFCALASAACTLAAAASAGSFMGMWCWRVLTGFFLAGIYPVGMKLATQWFAQGLGTALGWLVGALVLGSASAHALRAAGAQWPWPAVFVGVALASLVAAALVMFGLTEPPPPAPGAARPRLHWRGLSCMWSEPRLRASVVGYFGHMWELYSMWVLVPLILATRLQGAALSWAAFVVLGAGVFGCVVGGHAATRFGSAKVAAWQLAVSGLCCVLAPWCLQAGDAVFAAWLLVWGVSVVGDSPQFSTLTARNAPPHAVGSVLTLTNSLGFAISAASIALFVGWLPSVGLPGLLPWLGVGPVLGLWALWPLLRKAQ